ncbi:MAG TPA: superinfection immunity protein [Streptosporangiaceae bacterium]|nr:superinfection immunity protein [Streptosporangiaceae bacterium]
MITVASSAATGPGSAAWGFVFIVLAFAAYWVPTIVALMRTPPHFGSIIVVNVFLGWTVVGWVVALAMACRSRPQQPQYVVPPGWAPPPAAWQPWTPPDAGPTGWTTPPAPDAPASGPHHHH